MNINSISNLIIEYDEKYNLEILNNYLKGNMIYKDKYFLPNYKSIQSELNCNDDNDLFENIYWEKYSIKNIINYENIGSCKILYNNINFEDLNICFEIFREKPILIERIFENLKVNNNNIYGIWLNVDNNWRLYLIDNYLPFVDSKIENKTKIAFSYINDNSMWSTLITKALAKAKGNYENILNQDCITLLYELTGINPEINKLAYSMDLVEKINNYSSKKNKMVLCYRSLYFKNNKKLNFNIKNLKYVLIKKLFNKNNLLYVELIQSNYLYKNQINNTIILFHDFINEFDKLCFYDLNINYINNIKYDNEEIILFKFFLHQNTSLDINMIQDTYFIEEKKFGIKNSQTFINEDTSYSRTRIPLNLSSYNHSYFICRFNDFNDFNFINYNDFKVKYNTENLNLKKGEYIFLMRTNWPKNKNKLYTMSIQINSKEIIELQNINSNLNKYAEIIEKENILQYINLNNIIHNKSYEFFKMMDFSINVKEYFWNKFDIKVFVFQTNSNKNLKLNLMYDSFKGYKSYLKDNKYINFILTKGKDYLLYFKKIDEITNNYSVKLKLKNINIIEDYKKINDDTKYLKNYPKDKINSNTYYNLKKEINEDCKIF